MIIHDWSIDKCGKLAERDVSTDKDAMEVQIKISIHNVDDVKKLF